MLLDSDSDCDHFYKPTVYSVVNDGSGLNFTHVLQVTYKCTNNPCGRHITRHMSFSTQDDEMEEFIKYLKENGAHLQVE